LGSPRIQVATLLAVARGVPVAAVLQCCDLAPECVIDATLAAAWRQALTR